MGAILYHRSSHFLGCHKISCGLFDRLLWDCGYDIDQLGMGFLIAVLNWMTLMLTPLTFLLHGLHGRGTFHAAAHS